MKLDRSFLSALAYVGVFTVAVYFAFGAPFLLSYLVSISSAAFVVCGLDKSRARAGGVRIPERVLWMLAVLGGSVGILLGMKVFRHKTRKDKFKLVMGGIVLLQGMILLFLILGTSSAHAQVGEHPAVRIAFGSCLDNPKSGIWAHILAHKPDAFVFLGDNVYLDERDWGSTDTITARYRKAYAVPEIVPLFKSTRVLAIWDDHDAGPNNADSNFAQLPAALAAFRKQWRDGSNAPPANIPESIAYSTVVRNVHLILTDNRSYRINPGKPNSQLFGSAQIDWIESELKSPRGNAIILASGGQLLDSNGDNLESLSQYPAELARITRALASSPVPVTIISGDRHYAEILEGTFGTESIVETTSSPLGAEMRKKYPAVEPRRIGVYRDTPNFGLVTIEFRNDTTVFETQVFDAEGREVLRYPK